MFPDTDSNSEIQKTSQSNEPSKSLQTNNIEKEEMSHVTEQIHNDKELPPKLRNVLLNSVAIIDTDWQKTTSNKSSTVELLNTEVDLLDCIHKLRMALRTDHANYQVALESLEQMSVLQMNTLMLKKHKEIVDTIKKVAKYVGNIENWELNPQEAKEHNEKITQVRRKAETVLNKCISLFTVPDGKTFHEIYTKEVEDFYTKTKHLPCDQLYGLTSDKMLK